MLETPGQLGLALGVEELGDQVVGHEGSKVLLVASGLEPVVEGVTLDVEKTSDVLKLVAQKE